MRTKEAFSENETGVLKSISVLKIGEVDGAVVDGVTCCCCSSFTDDETQFEALSQEDEDVSGCLIPAIVIGINVSFPTEETLNK